MQTKYGAQLASHVTYTSIIAHALEAALAR